MLGQTIIYDKYQKPLFLVSIILIIKLFLDPCSPLNLHYDTDLGIFMHFGTYWNFGKLPYVDAFDHKGPYLFLIHAFAQYLSVGKWGLFILSSLNLYLIGLLAFRIVSILTKDRDFAFKNYIILMGFYAYFSVTNQVGGMSEEFSLLFSLLPLYLMLKFLHTGRALAFHPLCYSLCYGFCFGIISLIRLNNATVLFGLVVGALILLIKQKAYQSLLKNILCCALGFSLAIAPMFLYFGYYGALDEMLYATFTFNFIYAGHGELPTIGKLIFKLLKFIPAWILIPLSINYDRRFNAQLSFFTIPGVLLYVLSSLSSFGFTHYYLNTLPYFLLSLVLAGLLYPTLRNKVIGVAVFSMILFPYDCKDLLDSTYDNIRALLGHDRWEAAYQADKELLDLIPLEERNSIYAYNIAQREGVFINDQIIPIGKYLILNEFHASFDTLVKQEMDQFHTTASPTWIVTAYEDQSIKSTTFKELLETYDEIKTESTSRLRLFKRTSASNSKMSR